ncbi:MAG: hypothetical protein K2N48_11720 [Muribaculaceae bacterium]|nr:hypothetical protein [Muribaculaceae bacterium]
MKKLLLLSGLSAIVFSSFAESPEPAMIEDATIVAISPNGNYAVSQGSSGIRIFNIASGEECIQISGEECEDFYAGDGNCISDNGIVVASSPSSASPYYWKDGMWHTLGVPSGALTSNHAQGVSTDGSRICGNIRIAGMGNDEDVLMVVPCVWNAEGDGFGKPVMLPHPDVDYAERVPQYITAIDISSDGKIVLGQIRDAQGILNYPIIYKEDENGEWSYEIPHEDLINPDHVKIVPFPGEGPIMPQYESFMTQEEIAEYTFAYNEYVNSGCTIPCPEYWQFMSPDEIAEYNRAADVYNEKATAYNEKFEAWVEFITAIVITSPDYAFNQVRLSPDGKTFGCTVQVEGEMDPMTGFPSVENSVWLFDLTSDKITKYNKNGDLNIFYVANNGIGIGTTSAGTVSDSYILQDGEVIDILSWMNSKVPAYATWIKDNMLFPYEQYIYNEEKGDYEYIDGEVIMTGRATATPDFSKISLSVLNVWDGMDEGPAYIFNMKADNAVTTVCPASGEKIIYDLSGRRLREAKAPGIYIINGEKKVIR